MNNTTERLEELERQYAELGEAIKQLKEKKKWEPEEGGFYVMGDGEVCHGASERDTRLFGTERKTREQAEKARDKMRVFNRLQAYADEFAPDYEFEYDQRNWFIFMREDGEVDFGNHTYTSIPSIVYMPHQVAIDLCEKLNSGEVEL